MTTVCTPSCCPPPTAPPRAGGGLWALLAVFPLALWLADGRWPIVLLALIGATALTGGGLWLIAALAQRLNRAVHGPGIGASTVPARPVTSDVETPYRIQVTATDLPPTPMRPSPRVLTHGEVDALTASRPLRRTITASKATQRR